MAWNWDGLSEKAHPGRGQQFVELMVFLALIVPSMIFSFFGLAPDGVTFRTVALANILRDLALLALVLYFVWSNGESFSALGWRFQGVWREVLVGLWIFIPLYLGVALIGALLQQGGLSGMDEPPTYLIPRGTGEYLLAFIFLIVVAVTEETIFRGYLLLRLGTLTGNPGAAVVLSAVIFSVGHGYQGTAGVVAVGLLGLIYALIYLWRGSLIAPMVLHFLQNATGIIFLPLALAS